MIGSEPFDAAPGFPYVRIGVTSPVAMNPTLSISGNGHAVDMPLELRSPSQGYSVVYVNASE
jgi:hypothetical protein